jgi:hypothetical protein
VTLWLLPSWTAKDLNPITDSSFTSSSQLVPPTQALLTFELDVSNELHKQLVTQKIPPKKPPLHPSRLAAPANEFITALINVKTNSEEEQYWW